MECRGVSSTDRRGFTLIELLVVIAIIAIMSAVLMPAVTSTTDRARVSECRSNLTHVAIALKMYYNDQGAYPPEIETLHTMEFITDPGLMVCTKTGAHYHYAQPTDETATDALVCSCVSPRTPDGERPHSYRHSYVALHKGGAITEVGR
ncbi:MAG: prepilin-type N-terminal cleavage/methylation domain-containing protein [Armatimonadia bacterium]|nr:prepilin-type N-terminal cleavage/methylation domain-containing protein [Armatimonadia bacterium]